MNSGRLYTAASGLISRVNNRRWVLIARQYRENVRLCHKGRFCASRTDMSSEVVTYPCGWFCWTAVRLRGRQAPYRLCPPAPTCWARMQGVDRCDIYRTASMNVFFRCPASASGRASRVEDKAGTRRGSMLSCLDAHALETWISPRGNTHRPNRESASGAALVRCWYQSKRS